MTRHAYFGEHMLCIHAPTCGAGPALEHNGDLYSCDHYVEPGYHLGNIHETHMLQLVASSQQRKFGLDNRDTLTRQCLECDVRHLCHGGCPKDRFVQSRHGEPGQNYMCEGLELFYRHTRPAMETMAALLRENRAAADVMHRVQAQDRKRGSNDPCPCGGGRKFKHCHGHA